MIENKPNSKTYQISIRPFLGRGPWGQRLTRWSPALDRILGLQKLDRFYRRHSLSGLPKEDYCDRALKALNITVKGRHALRDRVPKTGAVVVVANHPCGGIEGVILARELAKIRPDTKILANKFLRIFYEIRDFFIFTNPLNPRDPQNPKSLKECHAHLKAGGLLLVFPAGKVSHFRKEKNRITDGEWNRLPVRLALQNAAPILPLFVDGRNSSLFYLLGRLYYRLRLVMLPRELLKQKNKKIRLIPGKLLPVKLLKQIPSGQKPVQILRALTYMNEFSPPQKLGSSEQDKGWQPLAPVTPISDIERELLFLAPEQTLYRQDQYSVYFGYQNQIPNTVREICRLREETFRRLDEGSGNPLDTDGYDATYTHLFVYDREEKKIVGAYRMGQTDRIETPSSLYLSQMFDFGKQFVNYKEPCLEMGRSFIALEFQKNLHGLALLWKGIGAFINKHPQYKTLYGTVSLSPQFSRQSLAVMQTLIPMVQGDVQAKNPLEVRLHPEIHEYIQNHKLTTRDLPLLVQILESGRMDIPVLFRQYQRLGAQFYTIGIDSNFNQTPGLLLSVDIRETPEKILKRYMGTVPNFREAQRPQPILDRPALQL